jgi:hypothetical protein
MTDANGDQMTKFMDFDDVAKIALFSLNMAHSDEHQGNMVTYLQSRNCAADQRKSAAASTEVNLEVLPYRHPGVQEWNKVRRLFPK